MNFLQCRAARADLSRDFRSVLRPQIGGLRGKWWRVALALIAAALVCGAQQPAAAAFTQQGNKLVGTGADKTGGTVYQGHSVALSADGNTLVEGGYGDNRGAGAVWVFTRGSNGSWSQQGQKLIGSDATGAAAQGRSVALSADGNTLVEGGYGDNGYAGAVWVFTRDSNGTWSQQGQKLVGTSATGAAQQGSSAALSADGNTLVEGGYDDNGHAGAVWVFTRDSNGTWSQQGQKLIGTSATGAAQQGISVALSADGNALVEGGEADNGGAGAVWVFTRDSSGTWSQQGQKLVGSGGTTIANQGISVVLSNDGNILVEGGYGDNGYAGAVWVFTRDSNGTWSQQGQKLVGTGGAGQSFQGWSVALSADGNALVEAGDGDNSGAGAVWVFARGGNGTWSQQGQKLVGTGAVGHATQGISVALSKGGNTLAAGGRTDNNNFGAVWVFVQPAAIAVSASPSRGGTVTGGGSFNPGTSQTVIATANAGYKFTNWTEGNTVVSTAASYTFTVGAARALVANFAPLAAHDFSGDARSDILWHNGNGSAAMWLMNGTTPVTQNVIGFFSAAWQIAGTSSLVQSTGDFDGDGKADMLWRNSDGTVVMWLMNGTTPTTQAVIGTIDTAWQIAGIGDFDGDGKADILWRKSDGTLAMWLMNGTTPTTQVSLGTVDTAWQVVGIGDFDGDGKADILWRKSDGTLAMWLMNGTTPKTQIVLGTVDTAWQVVGVADFDGDSKADIVWHKSDGSLAMWLMNGTTPTTQTVVGTVGTAWQVVSTGDYDGDGKGDILWRKTDGGVAMWLMNGVTPTTQTVIGTVDTAWSVVE